MKQEIKQRIEQIKNGEVPQGYKKTKIGIVPNEWEIERYKKYIKICSGRDQKEIVCEYGKYPILGTGGKIGNTNNYLYDKPSVLIGRKGTIDKPQYMDTPFWTVDTLFYSKIFDGAIPKFIYYKFCFVNWYKYNEASGVPSLNSSTIENIITTIPPLKEQQKIIDILSTQEKVIELKEKLLKEKEKKKKYLMQILLTGRKRLKGFDGEWKKVKLKEYLMEISERNKGLKINNVLSVNNKLGFVKQEIQFGKTVASKDLSNYKIIKNNFIAYNPSRINVGSIAMYEGEVQGIVSPMYVVFKTNEMLDSNYFMFFVQSYEFFEKMKSLLSGSVRDSLNFSDLCNMQILLPSLEEQKAISEILTTADKELKLLQEELEEEKRKKKALMQLLLTGIVRVKV